MWDRPDGDFVLVPGDSTVGLALCSGQSTDSVCLLCRASTQVMCALQCYPCLRRMALRALVGYLSLIAAAGVFPHEVR